MKLIKTRNAEIPALGFGTWEMTSGECERAVKDALEIGYRHIDTAQIYENEHEVGAAVAASGLDRSALFLTTKVWRDNLAPDAVLSSTAESLDKLRTDYIDLLLIHWPNPEVPLEETLDALLELHRADKIRHIGVSNFTPGLLRQALDHTSVVCDQVEYHPFLGQEKLLQFCQAEDVALMAYCPLARGKVVKDPTIGEIAERHGKSPAQVTLRWLLQQGAVAIPKASRREHARDNFAIFDFELSPPEMAAIGQLGGEERIIDPSFAPTWERF